MRVLLDYRPALRERTGVGEWVHELARAMLDLRRTGDPLAEGLELVLWTSSRRDRPEPQALQELEGAELADHRIPVRWVNRSWYRWEWPPLEWWGDGAFDIVHATAPALAPTRRGLRVLTVCDLDFLHHPERAWGEMQADFPRLVRRHAMRANLVVTISDYSREQIARELGVDAARIVRCRPGVPRWLGGQPPRDSAIRPDGYILFVGTLEPRKNVPGLLDAYERLCASWPEAPRLVLAGRPTPAAAPWLERMASGPLAGRVETTGYVDTRRKLELYRSAALLVLVSHDEGFGLPALEAMALGVPTVVSRCGSLPEVVADAGWQVDPADPDAIANAMRTLLTDRERWQTLHQAGIARAALFDWRESARTLLGAYRSAWASQSGTAGHQARGQQ